MEWLGIAALIVVIAYGHQGVKAMAIVVGCYILAQFFGGE